MSEFKIGRRVRVVGNGYHYTGHEGRLAWRKPADPAWYIDFGGNGLDAPGPSFVESELELIPDDEPEAMPQPAVDHGYYHAGDLEAIEVARKVFTPAEIAAWGKIAAWLYLWRDGKKPGTDDVRKAYEHLGMILETRP